jgi:Acyl-protein synthetase, LuxE
MNQELSSFAARLRAIISALSFNLNEAEFAKLAWELFALQFQFNVAYRKICVARKLTPETVSDWRQIPAVPTSLFKELELTALAPAERAAVFHSSGTTEQKPSRHFHSAESLALYEASLWRWFRANFSTGSKFKTQNFELICLTPPPEQVPHSSLVHMFETLRQKFNAPESVFTGKISDAVWTLDFSATLAALEDSKLKTNNPKLLLGTAFSFVHLLDYLAENKLSCPLPPGSRVMETGGYKNRSRSMLKAELHALIEKFFDVPRDNIICEYGMSELSSQAYESVVASQPPAVRSFQFPPWAKVQIISPETGREVADGETGLIRIMDLANVFSVAAVQTEDLAVRYGDGFELIGRAQLAEPRGCSLMTA